MCQIIAAYFYGVMVRVMESMNLAVLVLYKGMQLSNIRLGLLDFLIIMKENLLCRTKVQLFLGTYFIRIP